MLLIALYYRLWQLWLSTWSHSLAPWLSRGGKRPVETTTNMVSILEMGLYGHMQLVVLAVLVL